MLEIITAIGATLAGIGGLGGGATLVWRWSQGRNRARELTDQRDAGERQAYMERIAALEQIQTEHVAQLTRDRDRYQDRLGEAEARAAQAQERAYEANALVAAHQLTIGDLERQIQEGRAMIDDLTMRARAIYMEARALGREHQRLGELNTDLRHAYQGERARKRQLLDLALEDLEDDGTAARLIAKEEASEAPIPSSEEIRALLEDASRLDEDDAPSLLPGE